MRCISFIFILALVYSLTAADEPQTKVPAANTPHPERIKAGTQLFKASVRQILVQRCLSCHGGETAEGEFNLATRDGLLKGGEGGAAVVPGKSAESRLYRLITHEVKPHMPYDEEKLPDAEITAIAKWIDLEAPYDQPLVENTGELTDWTQRTIDDEARQFWSFQPLKAVPAANIEDEWCQTDIDQFVIRALKEKGIRPNQKADRRVLIRRAYFGLIGLPPAAEELAEHLNDESQGWYEKMIDRLLGSDHFGERWARHWLDIARFGESHGFEQDYDRPHAFHYRDFVIRAFNQDMPYDQFVRWQLAGDELAPDDPLALMATGFLGAGVFPTQLTEKEFEPARYDELDDMVSTMGTAMLGMTIGCARCHDHKFDPIPAADYYRLISTFGKTIRSNIEFDLTPEETKRSVAEWEKAHQPLVDQLQEFEQLKLGERFDVWLEKEAPQLLKTSAGMQWLYLHPTSAKSSGGATLTVQPDESILATGTNPDFDTYVFTAETQVKNIRMLRLEALAHDTMTKGGPGRAGNGNMGLSLITVMAEPLSGDADPVQVALTNPRATFEQNNSNLSIAGSIDDVKNTGWAVDPQFGKDHAAVFDIAEPVGFPGGTRLTMTLSFQVNNKHNIGRARLSISDANEALAFDAPSQSQGLAELLQLVASGTKPANDAQRRQLLSWYRTLDPEWKRLSAAVAAHTKSRPAPKLTTVMVSSEGVPPIPHHADGRGFPHFYKETYFLKRGDTTQKVRAADSGFLQVLDRSDTNDRWESVPPDGARTSFRRSALANWITDAQDGAGHLLARVIVNRLWQHHIGTGIVPTPNDFGKQGEPPTHPELLDWLAQRLIDNGWRLKPIHKLIVMSSVFQQNSDYDDQRATVDPLNQLYWRREPRRLEAEVIRDAMLVVSNQLDRRFFGAGTLDEGQKRRSIYFMIKRSKLIPMMQIFDSPEPLASVGNRPTTTIASQALMFMNSAHVREYAAAFAKRLPGESASDLVEQAFLTGISRRPTDLERSSLQEFLLAQSASYQADGKSVGDAEQLALTDLCQTIFGLNEFVFVD